MSSRRKRWEVGRLSGWRLVSLPLGFRPMYGGTVSPSIFWKQVSK